MNTSLVSFDFPLPALRHSLLNWGYAHYRTFPWREADNPYHILLAEVFLHRTQVRQAENVYKVFVQRYPRPVDVFAGNSQEIHQLLSGLGLRWRAELLIKMVRELYEKYDGEVPRQREALLALPGVSAYIAGAVCCFAWNEPEVLLDTNTVRVTGRLLGWEIKDSSRRSARFRHALEALLDQEHPRAFNYALLDLAHLICLKRQSPRCTECPLKYWCQFAKHQSDGGKL